MPVLDLDFGGVNAIPPEGVWRIHINKATYKSNKAKDGYIIDFDAEWRDLEDWDGKKVFPNPNASLKPAARWKLQEILSAITQEDWEDDGMQLEVEEQEDGSLTVPMLHDKTALVIVTHDTYNNRPTISLGTWIRDDGATPIGTTIPGESAASSVV